MKYQIILESEEILPDGEFNEMMKELFYGTNLTFLYAQNLEGIRKELYEKKEELKANTNEEYNENVEESFESIKELFKL